MLVGNLSKVSGKAAVYCAVGGAIALLGIRPAGWSDGQTNPKRGDCIADSRWR